MPEPRKLAAALNYPGHGAPKVVAAGKGLVAERILELAREAGVPIREDSALAQALAELNLGHEIPPALYQAVAEALVWALRLDRSLSSGRNRL